MWRSIGGSVPLCWVGGLEFVWTGEEVVWCGVVRERTRMELGIERERGQGKEGMSGLLKWVGMLAWMQGVRSEKVVHGLRR
jgi:hypothetical protein